SAHRSLTRGPPHSTPFPYTTLFRSRACGNDGAGRGRPLQPRSLEPYGSVAVSGGVGAASLLQYGRPGFGDDLAEIQRHLPPGGEIAVHKARKLRPVGSFRLDLVDEICKVAREPDGVCRGCRDDGFFLEQGSDVGGQAALPGAHERRKQQQPVRSADRRREVQRGGVLRACNIKGRLILVEFTQGADSRQDSACPTNGRGKLRAQ